MATRRCISKEIIESDAFLDLSFAARALYGALVVEADDDGVVGAPRRVMRAAGCQPKHLEELYRARFLLEIGNGVAIIKHWRMMNYIPRDRYKPSVYQDELRAVYLKADRSYTLNRDERSLEEAVSEWAMTGESVAGKLNCDAAPKR